MPAPAVAPIAEICFSEMRGGVIVANEVVLVETTAGRSCVEEPFRPGWSEMPVWALFARVGLSNSGFMFLGSSKKGQLVTSVLANAFKRSSLWLLAEIFVELGIYYNTNRRKARYSSRETYSIESRRALSCRWFAIAGVAGKFPSWRVGGSSRLRRYTGGRLSIAFRLGPAIGHG